MLLQGLELQGFKTFPDKTSLTFGPGICAVVGPNGSGKSNISDAVRWVLGEQSTRALRCSKMEDVIFGGTAGRKPTGFAQVTLTIDNTARELPFDKDTLSVTRRYYRSGESEYLLNQAAVRLKDIHELFMNTGLGRDGYSLIGQGKIDAVISARPQDRREIFEEAAGISRYRYRREEAQRRLAQAEENLSRLQDLAGELESRLQPLRGQAEKARRYLAWYEEKKKLEIGLWLHTMETSGQALREQEDKIAVHRSQLLELETESARLEQELEQVFQQTNACTARTEELRAAASQKEAEALRLEGEIRVFQNDKGHYRRAWEQTRRQGDKVSAAVQEREKALEASRRELFRCRKQVHKQQAELTRCSEREEQLAQEISVLSQQMQDISRQLDQLSEQQTEIQWQKASALSSKEHLHLRQNELQRQCQERQEQLSAVRQAGRDLEKEAERLRQEIQEQESRIEQAEQDAKRFREQQEQWKRKKDQAQMEVDGQIRKIRFLEEMERGLEGFSHSVKAVLRGAEQGGLSGIHGPVSQLIQTEPSYALAMEVALGAAAQHIVVEDASAAKAAIRFLQKQKAGRATFLPLSTVRGKPSALSRKEWEACPGFLGFAGELCRIPQAYREVLDSLLGKVAVMEELDTASAAAKRFQYRFRIVTLDGQVIHAGGAFTGGSASRQAGSLSRRGEIARMKETLRQLERELEKADAPLQQAAGQREEAERLAGKQQPELAQCRERLLALMEQYHKTQSQEELFENQCQELKTQSRWIEDRLQEIEQGQVQAGHREQQWRDRQTQKQEKLELCLARRETLRQEREALLSWEQELQLSLLSARKDEEQAQARQTALAEQARQAWEEKASLEETCQAAQDRLRELDAQEMQAQETAGECRVQAEAYRKEAEDEQHKRMALEQESLALRESEREASQQREGLAQDLARLEERRGYIQKEYDGITGKLWEEYGMTLREARQIVSPIKPVPAEQRRLAELKNQIRDLGNVNVSAVEEYEEVQERYSRLSGQIQDVERACGELGRLIRELTSQMQEQFSARFRQIGVHFQETFRALFGGGAAQLLLHDPDNLLETGVEIAVQLPGKRAAHLELLSGGEKTLVAIALYFAIMQVNPPPFCIMDEIDAALDEANVARFAAYLRRMSRHTQYILVTHRRGSMEEADVLYGVTMQEEGVSKLLKMEPKELEQMGEIG